MKTRQLITAIATGIAALALGAPVAGAGDTPVDDYWLDQAPVAATTPDTLVDDYWNDTPAVVVSSGGAFAWGDFGLGVATTLGAMLMLAGLGVGFLALRPSGRGDSRSTGMV